MTVALARGIAHRGSGWMSKTRARAWNLKQARAFLVRSRRTPELSQLYRDFLAESRSRDEEVARAADNRLGPELIQRVQLRMAIDVGRGIEEAKAVGRTAASGGKILRCARARHSLMGSSPSCRSPGRKLPSVEQNPQRCGTL
jgi:hypothetical protein